jgi:hypothetical protein
MLSDSFGIANDAQLGRFVQPDPIVPDPGDPQSLNRYSYCANNPVRFTDPSGHYYYDPSLDALVHNDVPTLEHPEYLERETAYEMTNPLGATIVQGMLIQERYETAIGVRLEGTAIVMPELGLDANLELLYKKHEGFRVFATFSTGQIRPGLPGADATVGPVVVTNISSLDEYSGLAATAGGTIAVGPALEVDVSTSDPLDPKASQVYYLGIGKGAEASGYIMIGETQSVAALTQWFGSQFVLGLTTTEKEWRARAME